MYPNLFNYYWIASYHFTGVSTNVSAISTLRACNSSSFINSESDEA